MDRYNNNYRHIHTHIYILYMCQLIALYNVSSLSIKEKIHGYQKVCADSS